MARMYNDENFVGWLEMADHFNYLPDGGGNLRPSDAIELATMLCDIEEETGAPVQWDDMPALARQLCRQFARWEQADRYGPLAEMVVSEARRIMADLS